MGKKDSRAFAHTEFSQVSLTLDAEPLPVLSDPPDAIIAVGVLCMGRRLMGTAEEEVFEQGLQAYLAAGRTLDEWISGARALALLRGALSSGVLETARTPSTAARIAAVSGLDEDRVEAVCLALVAHGVFERDGGYYRLSPDFSVLASPEAVRSLPDVLAREEVLGRSLESAASPQVAYTALSSEDVLALAVGLGMRPTSPTTRAFWAAAVRNAVPEAHALWVEGGRHLELGCGVANALLSLLASHPSMTATGVELDEAALAVARRRAEVLGVTDRVEFRHADARDLEEEEAFETASWSQQFFPAEGREEVLVGARRALKPGGYLVATMFGDPPGSGEALREPQGRTFSLDRMLYGGWGVPVLSKEGLRAELEAAGFEVLRTVPAPPNPLSVSRGLMLARRPRG